MLVCMLHNSSIDRKNYVLKVSYFVITKTLHLSNSIDIQPGLITYLTASTLVTAFIFLPSSYYLYHSDIDKQKNGIESNKKPSSKNEKQKRD